MVRVFGCSKASRPCQSEKKKFLVPGHYRRVGPNPQKRFFVLFTVPPLKKVPLGLECSKIQAVVICRRLLSISQENVIHVQKHLGHRGHNCGDQNHPSQGGRQKGAKLDGR